ncbi:hypothetical protein [Streptomyces smyrnaeus]|uniref:hypothetical protein n=1 Tax=Streptomyces smyrnaeus TaxID=1387713 RepID=UPI0033FB9B53
MTNVDDQIQARIAEQQRRREERRQRRAELAEARAHGLTARMRTKMRRWDDEDDGQGAA